MYIRTLGYMNFRFFLIFLFLILVTRLGFCQVSDRDRLFNEANESRFKDPQKSLKLYDYLLTNSKKEEAIGIKIKKIQINRLLGYYPQAVDIVQDVDIQIRNLTNPAFKYEYYSEVAKLYKDLDLTREGKKLLAKAQSIYDRLPSEKQNKYSVDLQFLEYKYANGTSETRITELRSLLKNLDKEDARKYWAYHLLGTSYYPIQKDSARTYFKKIGDAKETSPLNQSARIYIELLDSKRIADSVIRQSLKGVLFDQDLGIILLNNAIDFWEAKANTDSLVYYQKQLHQLQQSKQLKKRRAKVGLLQHLYSQKKNDVNTEAQIEKKWFVSGIILLSILLLFYGAYKFRSQKNEKRPIESDSSKTITISDKTEDEILEKLRKFEESELFLDQQMRVATLAKHLDTNTRYLSSIINSAKDKSFNNYINSLRIHYILGKLDTDAQYLNYKVSYLAKESGFASQSSFTTAFKEVTGLTPSAYIKKSTK